MARLIIIGLVALVLVAATSACSSGSGGGGGGMNIPLSNSGRPFGFDITRDLEAYPNYDSRSDSVGLGLEYRLRSDVDVRVNVGVGGRELLRGQLKPQGGVELQMRYRRRRSEEMAVNDEEISRLLFSMFDLDKNGKIDAADWTREGGKVATFADMLKIYDVNVDDEISLEEFLQIPLMSNLGVGLDLALFKQKVFPQPAEELAPQAVQPEQAVAAQPAEPEQD